MCSIKAIVPVFGAVAFVSYSPNAMIIFYPLKTLNA
jgi:hypothetical protein